MWRRFFRLLAHIWLWERRQVVSNYQAREAFELSSLAGMAPHQEFEEPRASPRASGRLASPPLPEKLPPTRLVTVLAMGSRPAKRWATATPNPSAALPGPPRLLRPAWRHLILWSRRPARERKLVRSR